MKNRRRPRVFNAADYASLSAVLAAAPSGSTIRLAAGTTYPASALTKARNVIIEGSGYRPECAGA